MKTPKQTVIKSFFVLYLIPVSVLFVISSMTAFSFFGDTFYTPTLSAWILATVNFIAALWSLTIAQNTEFTSSILLVFAGTGVRMIIMISSIVIIMLKKADWMLPFCTVLLECFILYLIIEIAVIYKRGLLQQS